LEHAEKYHRLSDLLKKSGKVAVAFSGGVDSTFLAKAAHDSIGDDAIAITLVSPMNPRTEIEDAKAIVHAIGIRHILIEDDLIDEAIARNPEDRCYHCKKIEFKLIKQEADRLGYGTVLDGTNHDDLSDYRPGMKALIELEIKSPLRECGFTKQEIRALSKELGLPTWNKPALACLASRVPYGDRITKELLTRIEQSEDYLRSIGFRQFRVRSHGDIARIEVNPDERGKFFDLALLDKISETLKSFGYRFVTFDLEGYRMGKMNVSGG
jgi:uncharacterized protein